MKLGTDTRLLLFPFFFATCLLCTAVASQVPYGLKERRHLFAQEDGNIDSFVSTHPTLSKLTDFDLLEHSDEHRRQLENWKAVGDEEQVTYGFEAFGERYDLLLTRHRVHNSNALPVFTYRGDEHHHSDQFTGEERVETQNLFSVDYIDVDCFYKGYLVDAETEQVIESSQAIMSFCDDEIRGVIKMMEESLEMQPVTMNSGRKLVAAYKSEHVKTDPWNCGNSFADEDEVGSFTNQAEVIFSEDQRSSKQQSSNSFVEVLFLVDKTSFDHYSVGTFSHTLFIFTLVNDLYANFPGTNRITLRVTGVVVQSLRDPWEGRLTFNGDNVIVDSSGQVTGLLSVFGTYLAEIESDLHSAGDEPISFDVAHLLSGIPLISSAGESSVVGLANVGEVCASSNRAIGVTEDQFLDARTATIVSHEIGHNLGFLHTNQVADEGEDGPDTTCFSNNINFIMDAEGTFATSWSTCSQLWWTEVTLPLADAVAGAKTCFITDANEPLNGPICGNGVVEDGEECDCGLDNCDRIVDGLTIDPCCDGSTCQYKAGAVCARNDLCCSEECDFANMTGEICREKRDGSDCDEEEVCTGQSKDCPEDTLAEFGIGCTLGGSDGNCFRGACISAEIQCQSVGLSNFCGLSGNRDEVCTGEDVFGLLCTSQCILQGSGEVHTPADGTVCDTSGDRGCYQGQCLLYSDIPTVDQCINFEQDGTETDIDCGGAVCLPCVEGKACVQDDDCFGTCNTTTSLCVGLAGSTTGDVFDLFIEWLEDNPVLAACIGSALLAIIVVVAVRDNLASRKRKRARKEQAASAISSSLPPQSRLLASEQSKGSRNKGASHRSRQLPRTGELAVTTAV